MKRILIIGSRGFLGSYFLKHKTDKFQIIGSLEIDISDYYNSKTIVEEIKPDVVVLCAAISNVDECERNKIKAFKVNTIGTKNIAEICKKLDVKFVYVSTDYVFDGEKGYYNEFDLTKPINYYGTTKFLGETCAYFIDKKSLICRTSVLYGVNKNKMNFVTWVLDALQNNRTIKVVANQWNSPTYVDNLVEMILKLIEHNCKGIYHTAGDCSLTRYEMALEITKKFGYKNDLIIPVTDEDVDWLAKRPRKADLDITKLKREIGNEVKILSFCEGLERLL